LFFYELSPSRRAKQLRKRKDGGVQQEAGAARPGAHDAPDAVAAHDTIDTYVAHVVKAPKRPKSAADNDNVTANLTLQRSKDIVKLVLDKAAAEEGATQGGSAGVGSQKAAEAEGEEGAIAHSTHLVTGDIHVHDSDVGTVRRKAAKKDKKENVRISEMARRVRNWGKPQNAQHSAWTWGFKYSRPTKGTGGFQNHAEQFYGKPSFSVTTPCARVNTKRLAERETLLHRLGSKLNRTV
jgi:hypothetical protein